MRLIRALWQLLIAALADLFQLPMHMVFIAAWNGAVPILRRKARKVASAATA